MKKPLVALALLAVLLLGALTFLLTSDEGGRGEAAPNDDAVATAPRDKEVEEPAAAQLDKPVALPGETDQREARTSGAKTAADVLTDDQSFELEDAQWAEVDLVLPNGIPLDDDLALVSFSSEGDEEMDRWTMSSLANEVDLTNGFVEEVALSKRSICMQQITDYYTEI